MPRSSSCLSHPGLCESSRGSIVLFRLMLGDEAGENVNQSKRKWVKVEAASRRFSPLFPGAKGRQAAASGGTPLPLCFHMSHSWRRSLTESAETSERRSSVQVVRVSSSRPSGEGMRWRRFPTPTWDQDLSEWLNRLLMTEVDRGESEPSTRGMTSPPRLSAISARSQGGSVASLLEGRSG